MLNIVSFDKGVSTFQAEVEKIIDLEEDKGKMSAIDQTIIQLKR